MINFKKTCLIFAGLAVLAPCAMAAGLTDQPADQNGALAYTGSDGRIGIGYDTKTNLRGDAYWIFSDKDTSALIGEGWISGAAGGLKMNYQWVPGGKQGLSANPSVRKLFAAIDQNQDHDQKLTLGGGLERENLFFGGYFSAALTGKRTLSDISSTTSQTISATDPSNGQPYTQLVTTTTDTQLTARAYDYGIGARVGRYFDQPLIRLTGGLDYEWGQDSNRQTTVSMKLEKFIANTPHSFSVDAELYTQTGPLEMDQNPGNKRLFFMYHYEFGGKNYRPEHPYHMVEAPVADTSQPADTTGSPAPAVDSQPKVEKRMVKTTASMSSDAFFEFDKSSLTPAAITALDSVIATLKKSGYSGNIHLTGHTCNIGTIEYNQKLSERRANSVKKYLVEHGGFPADSIIAEGKGELNPTYPNTREMRPKNRRVDLEFVTYAEKMEDVVLPAEPQAAGPATVKPAKVEWVREYIDTEPAWMRRALHSTIPHKESVDEYHQQESRVTVTNGPRNYPPNHAPVARSDKFAISTGAPTVLNVLANDYDPDGDKLTIVSFTQLQAGKISMGSNGTLVFTPAGTYPQNQFTETIFLYTISDGRGATASAYVTLVDP